MMFTPLPSRDEGSVWQIGILAPQTLVRVKLLWKQKKNLGLIWDQSNQPPAVCICPLASFSIFLTFLCVLK